MLDAITCSEAGLPSTALITTPFRKLAGLTAGNSGLAGFDCVISEHPIWTRDDAWLDAQAEKLADQVQAVFSKAPKE